MIDCSRFGLALVPHGTKLCHMGNAFLAKYSSGSSSSAQVIQVKDITIPACSHDIIGGGSSHKYFNVSLGVKNVIAVIAEYGIVRSSNERKIDSDMANYDAYYSTVYWSLPTDGQLRIHISTTTRCDIDAAYGIVLYYASA